MINVSFDTKRTNRELNEMMAVTGLTSAAVVTRFATAWCRDCVRMTPPTGSGKLATSKSAQRKLGERRIASDVAGRAFPLLSNLRLMKEEGRLGKAIDGATKRGDFKTATDLLRKAGVTVERVIAKPTESLHRSMRSPKTGRVLKSVKPYYVANESDRNRYLKQAVRRSGRAKSGWATACARLRLPRPGWGNHNAPGHFRGITDKQRPSIEFGNRVDFLQRNFYADRIMKQTLIFRQRQMRAELVKLWRGIGAGGSSKIKARFARSRNTFEAIEV